MDKVVKLHLNCTPTRTTAATKQRRGAMSLHLAGPDVQEIFITTLTETRDAANHASVVEAINTYFVPQVNSAFAHRTFHQITQNPGETVQQFVTCLGKAAKDCDFGTDTDNQIRDAVLNKCTSTYIKQKLLEEVLGLNLTRTLEVAAKCEKIETQLAPLSAKGEESESINKINERSNNLSTSTQGRFYRRDKICYRCGLMGHFSRDPQCPARGKTCRKVESVTGDSRANSNIIDKGTWKQLEGKGVKCESPAAAPDKKLYPYAFSQSLPVKGSFKYTVSVCH